MYSLNSVNDFVTKSRAGPEGCETELESLPYDFISGSESGEPF